MNKVFVVLTADLIASRRAPERPALARHLRAALRGLETRFASEWRAPLTLTRGIDELSGVLLRARCAFDIAVALNQAVWPQRFRFVVASGEIDVGGGRRDASAMDGAGFHLAADAMARARAQELPLALALPSAPEPARRMAEGLARLHDAILRGWTASQAEAAAAYRRTGTQSKAARRLGVTQQAVSQALRTARLAELLQAEEALRAWLDSLTLDAPEANPAVREKEGVR
jgi:hypothetical protein